MTSDPSNTLALYQDYGFPDAAASHMHIHFLPHVLALSGQLGMTMVMAADKPEE